MHRAIFDELTRSLPDATSRRHALRLIAGSAIPALAGWLGVRGSAAKKKKKKKTILCLDGQTIKASKKKKKKLIKRGATSGPCSPTPPGCTSSCPAATCGSDDGCGGICGCAAGSLCYSGVCHPCNVTCAGGSTTCGDELKTFLTGGGTVFACPGRYTGNFVLASNAALIGAGDGDDPASNTILDAIGSGRVVDIATGINAALHGLRITGGNTSASGGGLRNLGTVTLTACTVTMNDAASSGGGGIHNVGGATGPLTLVNCMVSENKGSPSGGGILNSSGATLEIEGSALTGNEASNGGGLYNQGTATFDSASSVTGNVATSSGGGIFNSIGEVTLNGASVSGNSAPQCVDVDGCPP